MTDNGFRVQMMISLESPVCGFFPPPGLFCAIDHAIDARS